VILTRRKLRHYFESHPVTVVSSFPLGEIIQCREASGRIAKWAVEVMGETISFAPRKAIKSQVLAYFVAEWVDTQLPMALIQPELWTMFFDGSLMKTGAGASLLFISPLGKHLRYVLHLHFPASNNVAEYEALVNGLRIAIELGVRRLDARGDSQLVIDQVMKNSHCRDPKMEAYCDEVRRLEDKFYGLELNHIARRYNETADELAKIASRRTNGSPGRLLPGSASTLRQDRRLARGTLGTVRGTLSSARGALGSARGTLGLRGRGTARRGGAERGHA
jgi:ribonuclease HI